MRKRPPAIPRTLWPAQPPALRRLCKIRSVFGTDDYSPTGGIFFQSLQRKGRAHNAKPRTFDAAKKKRRAEERWIWCFIQNTCRSSHNPLRMLQGAI